jgi:hypothetical protein
LVVVTQLKYRFHASPPTSDISVIITAIAHQAVTNPKNKVAIVDILVAKSGSQTLDRVHRWVANQRNNQLWVSADFANDSDDHSLIDMTFSEARAFSGSSPPSMRAFVRASLRRVIATG